MIFERYIRQVNTSVFLVSHKVIWASAAFMGILASIPKILQLKVSFKEVVADCIIAFTYSLYVWCYNIHTLPKFTGHALTNRFFGIRLAKSLGLGLLVMGVLVIVNQLLFRDRLIGSMILMYQFRGILINLTIYMFLYLLYQGHINQITGIELERTKADHMSAKYELLKQQVNPHFLFNSLNTLKAMVDSGDGDASNFIVNLSDFYRYTLESRQKDAVPMEHELKILEAYYFLVRSRFEEGISIKIDLSLAHRRTLVPTFTLQLLVENAVKHNIVSIDQPLDIEVISDNGRILVRNNLQPRNIPEPSTKIGLENINQRYMHLTGQTITVTTNNDFFTVSLPTYEHISDRR